MRIRGKLFTVFFTIVLFVVATILIGNYGISSIRSSFNQQEQSDKAIALMNEARLAEKDYANSCDPKEIAKNQKIVDEALSHLDPKDAVDAKKLLQSYQTAFCEYSDLTKRQLRCEEQARAAGEAIYQAADLIRQFQRDDMEKLLEDTSRATEKKMQNLKERVRKNKSANEIIEHCLGMSREEEHFLLEHERRYVERWKDHYGEVMEEIEIIRELLKEPEHQKAIDEISKKVAVYKKNFELMVATYYEQVEKEKVMNRTAEQAEVKIAEIRGKSKNNMKNAMAFASRMMIATGSLATLLALVAGLLLTRNISQPLRYLADLIRRLGAEGEISQDIEQKYMDRADEIGEISQATDLMLRDFRSICQVANQLSAGHWDVSMKIKGDRDEMNLNLEEMIDQVSSALYEVRTTVEQVTTGAQQVSSASQSMSEGATEQAASLEEISSSMQELGSQTSKNAQNATDANKLAGQATEAAQEGRNQMTQMVAAMGQITSNSEEVQKVVKVIDEIAFQTNLLALNAAVEAARAGQHGKGFAVVAEEVRNLAARSAKAAQETSELIEGSNRQIQEGADVAQRTSDGLNQIAEYVLKTTELVNEIANASNDQAQGASQISQGLSQIDQVTQQNTANAEETASVCQQMSQQALRLQNLVKRFKLKGENRTTKERDSSSGSGSPDAMAENRWAAETQTASHGTASETLGGSSDFWQ